MSKTDTTKTPLRRITQTYHEHAHVRSLFRRLHPLHDDFSSTWFADATLAAERYQVFVAAGAAPDAAEPMRQHSASQVAAQLLLDEARNTALVEPCGAFKVRLQMRADDAVQ